MSVHVRKIWLYEAAAARSRMGTLGAARACAAKLCATRNASAASAPARALRNALLRFLGEDCRSVLISVPLLKTLMRRESVQNPCARHFRAHQGRYLI